VLEEREKKGLAEVIMEVGANGTGYLMHNWSDL